MNKVSEKPALAQGETKASLPEKQWWRQDSARLVCLVIVVGLVAASFLYLTWRAAPPIVSGSSSCGTQSQSVENPAPSSIHAIKQAYNCILDTYPTVLDPRSLLQHAMSGMVNYLVQQHQDQRSAVLPALTGDRQVDWQAFERTYTTMTAHLSSNQQGLVAAAITGMVDGLHDDHANYMPPPRDNTRGGESAPPGTRTGLGIHLPFYSPEQFAQSSPPLSIRSVDPGSPAGQAGLRPGDTIITINGFPPFINQKPVQAVISPLSGSGLVQLQIQHPGADSTIRVSLTPAAYPADPLVSTRMLSGNILYVHFTQFQRGVYEQINQAVQEAGAQLKGVILDMRGNGGGDAEEQRRIISMFVHNQVISSTVDRQGQRSDMRTDDGIPLYHVRLVALIDRGCASACEATAMDIQDLHLGRLVGERTAGIASGPSSDFFLDDGSVVTVPVAFMQGPAGEVISGIGVPPDDEVYPTPADLAAGHDPVLERALQVL
ncbi:S41 family peptidase [Ktedonobacter racemifer]|uniref:Peptidase S41 n=1 Tax=Ktedonobacter racemifer DSM 44963 TaxID=485913 RepID=D6U0U5_KTERA|nr:S41 family peptidase [Ktedonobacter racemifer]EFH82435.1 peptidase S41 [Ktedonobacter racemifer DSM 44963]